MNNNEQKINALHDEYIRCRERYEQSPSIENGSRMGEARLAYENAIRESGQGPFWLDERGEVIA